MKVLLAIDSVVFSKIISDFVANYNWPPETEFRILHIIEPQAAAEDRAQAEKAASELTGGMVSLIKAHFPEWEISGQIVHGLPEKEIVRMAAKWKADMVVLGSHAKSEIAKLLVGSVSMQVVVHASCSVVVLRLPSMTEKALQIQSKTAGVKL